MCYVTTHLPAARRRPTIPMDTTSCSQVILTTCPASWRADCICIEVNRNRRLKKVYIIIVHKYIYKRVNLLLFVSFLGYVQWGEAILLPLMEKLCHYVLFLVEQNPAHFTNACVCVCVCVCVRYIQGKPGVRREWFSVQSPDGIMI